jgi:hypothetical protein
MSIDSLFKTPVIVISDPEGHDIYSLMNKNFCTNTKIIICGDIIDSTMSSRNDIMYDPKICNDLKLDLFKNKSYNLHNLDEIDKKNISVFLGNRDLNKIKCVFLNKLKRIAGVNDTSKLINHFNNGNDYNLVNNLYKINVTNTDKSITTKCLPFIKDLGDPNDLHKDECPIGSTPLLSENICVGSQYDSVCPTYLNKIDNNCYKPCNNNFVTIDIKGVSNYEQKNNGSKCVHNSLNPKSQ